MTKTALAAVFAVLSLALNAPAAEINAYTASEIKATSTAVIPEVSSPEEEATLAIDGQDPVVITVPGLSFAEIGWGEFELRNLFALIDSFSKDKTIADAEIVNGELKFSPLLMLPERTEEDEVIAREVKAERAQHRVDDDYLEQKIKEIPAYAERRITLVPFRWSRDPGESAATLPVLQTLIENTYDTYKGTGRPIYILAHSWGSVLTHTAMHRIARTRKDVYINKIVTAGSPLNPGNPVVSAFMKLEIKKEGLEKVLAKPANVGLWRNFWALRDSFSNAIPVADTNLRVDAKVENLEPSLISIILNNKILRRQAKKDLFKIRDLLAWHGSYFYDYSAEIVTLQKKIQLEIFKPALAPQLAEPVVK